MSTPPRTIDRGSRVVAGVAVRVTELVWPDERRSYEVHLINGDGDVDVDLTEDGCFDDPPTDAQISELLAEYRAATTLAGWATSAGLLRELLFTASTRIGWQVDLDQLPVTCAHTPHLVLALIDASAAHLAALAAHTALTEAAQSIQTIIAEHDRDTVDWFAAGLLGSIAQLANSRSPQLGHSRRALLAALSALQQEGVAWPPDPTPPPPPSPPRPSPPRPSPPRPSPPSPVRSRRPGRRTISKESTVDIEDVTHKYTGHRVIWTDLLTAHTHPLGADLADAVQRAAYAVGEIDKDLGDIAGFIDATVQTVRRTIAAAPGEPVPTLNFLGELQSAGPRLDALVAARHERIIRLRIVTALWRKFTALLAPPDLGQVLAAAGFAPLATAHANTRSAYRRRDGDREVTVSLDPYGQAGVEVTVSHGGVLAWTVTTGPHVPHGVVAAIAYTALTAKHRERDATAAPQDTPEPGSTLGA